MKKAYFLNCFLLLIPVFIWDILFIDSLPKGYSDAYWNDIPPIVAYTEHILKAVVFVVPAIMVLSLKTQRQKIGIAVYAVGVVIYFLSWYIQIYHPESSWSTSLAGFMAPAYTALFWLIGIGLIGKNAYIPIPSISRWYMVLAVCFVVVHSIHPYIVFQKL